MHFSTVFSGISLASLAFALPAFPPGFGGGSGSPFGSIGCGSISSSYAKLVVSQFTTDGIVPDLIEATTLGTPTVKVNVAYGSKQVNLGTYFTTTQTINAPTLNFTGERNFKPATTKYIYFLVDPDVPEEGSPAQVNFNHWTVADAQPLCITNQTPNTIVTYEAPTPASTTQHRYTFLVYRQPASFNSHDATTDLLLQVRTPFDLNDFTQDNDLVLVGGNFFKESITNGLQG